LCRRSPAPDQKPEEPALLYGCIPRGNEWIDFDPAVFTLREESHGFSLTVTLTTPSGIIGSNLGPVPKLKAHHIPEDITAFVSLGVN